MKNKLVQSLISIVGMLVMLALAFALDRWVTAARKSMSASFKVAPFIVTMIVIYLIFAAAILSLHWFANRYASKNIFTALVFLLAGLAMVAWPIFAAILFSVPSVLAVAQQLRGLLVYLHPAAYPIMVSASAFILLMGIYGLVRRQAA